MRPWMVKYALVACVLNAMCVIPGCTEPGTEPGDNTTPDDPTLAVGNDIDAIRAALEADGSVEVLVTIEADEVTQVANPTALIEPVADRLAPIFDQVLGSLPFGEFERFRVYRNFPTLALRLSSTRALDALLAHPRTVMVFENIAVPAALTESLASIHQPAAIAAGHAGAGTTVAVLDTGLDYTRAAFGSCTSPGSPSECHVIAAIDFAPNDGALDRGNFHGTNVSGIVLGVAPGAQIAGLDVFNGDSGQTSDIMAAVDWVIDNQATYNIVAMNLSLGGGAYTARCGSNPLEPALSTAKTLGIVAAIATGNNGYTNAVGWPACSPSAVAVGAVSDSNMGQRTWGNCTDPSSSTSRVTCFSNSASFIDLLAPGALITAADITMGGTSQASPHVAGAIAVLRGAFPNETADRTIERLKLGGSSVTDHRNGVTKPRLDLAGALNAGTAPTGSISIAADASVTKTASVTLSLTASGGVTQMCISNVSTCTAWIAFASSKTWTLSTGPGTKTVFARFRSNTTTVSETTSDTILFDAVAPTGGELTASAGDASADLSWSGFVDAHSGLASYKVVYATGAIAPASCNAGSVAYAGTSTSLEATGLTNGASYTFRVCAIDVAGNMSAGVTRTLRPAPEYDAPSGSVSINDGDAFTGNRNVVLAVSASDASTVTHMCISNATTCTSYVSFATTYNWTLTDLTGLKTVRVWLRDQYNNVASTPVSDTITLDKTAASNPTLNGSGSNGSVSLSWDAATDAHSGVASYKVIYNATATAPASCNVTGLWYTILTRSMTLTGLTNGTTYSFRLCAIDNVGNISAGSVRSLRPAPEYDPPTGSVSINSDATYTGNRSVTLAISASDANTVTHMCISNATTCTTYEAFNTSRAWTLADLTGTKAVRVWLRDQYNNVSSPLLDTITLDRTAPTLGAMTATGSTQSVALAWSGQSDAHSGFASYKVVYAASTLAPACSAGTTAYTGTDHGSTVTGLSANTAYSFRVCGIDNVGNMSAGIVKTVRTLP